MTARLPSAAPAHDLARADLCRLLAACYYEPGDEFIEERLFDSLVASVEHVDPRLARRAARLREAFEAQDRRSLLVDYARLYLGPPSPLAKPYACAWVAPERGEDPTLVLLSMYAEAGLEVGDDFGELPDHVAAELEFLYLLIHRRAAAVQAADEGAMQAADRMRKRFVAGHLARWIPPFAQAVVAGAQTPFYAELARLTAEVVAREAGAS